ncbi:MAG TPA: hypothetical protein VIE65_12370 [Methylobacter sp.]|jgi:hypothetical protein
MNQYARRSSFQNPNQGQGQGQGRNFRQNKDDQFVLIGSIAPSKSGGEVICFKLELGFIALTFIVTVPSEGTSQAPVYVKVSDIHPMLPRRWFDRNYQPNQQNDETQETGEEDTEPDTSTNG